MNKNKKYIILAMLIFSLFLIISILNSLNVQFQTPIGNAFVVSIFYTPIVILLFVIGRDERLNANLRFAVKCIAWFICVCYVAGAAVTFFST